MSKPRIQWKNLPASSLASNPALFLRWDALNTARGDLPFLGAGAIVVALKTLGGGVERLLVAYDGSTIVAMFLLSPAGKLQWQTFQPSQIPLGAWVAEAHWSLLELSQSLIGGPLGACLALSITQVDPLLAPRNSDTPHATTQDYVETAWVDIEGNFEDYWGNRGKNLRQNMRKQRAKLLADGINLRIQELHAPSDMATAIAQYGKMESAGWKANKGTAINADNSQGRYYRDLLEQASQRGEAVVFQYLFDDQIVAMNLCLRRNDTLVVLKTTYDETVKGYSPAFLLRESELQSIFSANKFKRMEYFGRLMDWHSKWTDKKRTLYHLTVYRWPLVKFVAGIRRSRMRRSGIESPITAH